MASPALTGKPQLNRVINRRLILDRIRRCETVSRADLAKQTEIRPPTVSAVVRELIEEGLVQEVGPGKTSGGRVPRMVSLTRQKPCALGFELRLNRVTAGLCDLSGALCDQLEAAVGPMSPEEAVRELHQLGSTLLTRAGLTWESLRGVGVAMPGHLDAKRGHVRWSRVFEWRDVPFKELCERQWGVVTDVMNDSQAGAVAAQQFEVKQPADNLVYVYLSFQNQEHKEIGIGTGIIIHGELYHGEFGAAGEITTPVAHPLVHYSELAGRTCDDFEQFVKAVQAGESAALKAIALVGEQIGPLVLHIVNLLEPGAFIVGSDTQELCDVLLQQFESTLGRNDLAYQAGKTRMVASMLGSCGVARGATVPTLQRVFRMPQWS
jgi:N-acetylglucosamine repressor